MNFVHDEYNALITEYNDFVLSLTIEKSEPNKTPSVEIITKENETLKVRLTNQGWIILSSTSSKIEKDSIFETSESLLMQASPIFTQLWNNKLHSKLLDLERFRDD